MDEQLLDEATRAANKPLWWLWLVCASLLMSCHPFESVDRNPFGDDGSEDGMSDMMLDVSPDFADLVDGMEVDIPVERRVEIRSSGDVLQEGVPLELTAQVTGYDNPSFEWAVLTGPGVLSSANTADTELMVDSETELGGMVTVQLQVTDTNGTGTAERDFLTGAIVFVDGRSGADTNTGRSRTEPVQTIGRALEVVQSIRAEDGAGNTFVAVWLSNSQPHLANELVSLPASVSLNGGFDGEFAPSANSAELRGSVAVTGAAGVRVKNLVLREPEEGSANARLSIRESSETGEAPVLLENLRIQQGDQDLEQVVEISRSTVMISRTVGIAPSDPGGGQVGLFADQATIIAAGSDAGFSSVLNVKQAAQDMHGEWTGIALQASTLQVPEVMVELIANQSGVAPMTGVDVQSQSVLEGMLTVTVDGGTNTVGVHCDTSECRLASSQLNARNGKQVTGAFVEGGDFSLVDSTIFADRNGSLRPCVASESCIAVRVEGGDTTAPDVLPTPDPSLRFTCCDPDVFPVVLVGNRFGGANSEKQASTISIGASRLVSSACLDGNYVTGPDCTGTNSATCYTARVYAASSWLHNNVFLGPSAEESLTVSVEDVMLSNNYVELGISNGQGSTAIGLEILDSGTTDGVNVINNTFDRRPEGNGIYVLGASERLGRLVSNRFGDAEPNIFRQCLGCPVMDLTDLVNAELTVELNNNGIADCIDVAPATFGVTTTGEFTTGCLNLGSPGEALSCDQVCEVPVTSYQRSTYRVQSTTDYAACLPEAPISSDPIDGYDIGPLAVSGE